LPNNKPVEVPAYSKAKPIIVQAIKKKDKMQAYFLLGIKKQGAHEQ